MAGVWWCIQSDYNNLHGNSKTRLEGGNIRSRHAARGREGDFGGDLTDQTGRNDAAAAKLGFDGADVGGLVGSTHGQNVAHFAGRVRRLTGNAEVVVDLVQQTDIVLREIGCGSDTGKERAGRVGGSDVDTTEAGAGTREVVLCISTNCDAVVQSHACRCGNVGHLHDVQRSSGVKVALDIVDAEISTFGSLEGKLNFRSQLKRRLQGLSTIGGELSFIDIEFRVGKFGANFRRKGSAFALRRFNGDGHRARILFALESNLVGIVVIQDV